MNKKLENKINAFLKEKRNGHGDWATPTDSDIKQLENIIYLLIDSKFKADYKGTNVIEFQMVNRKKERFLLPEMFNIIEPSDSFIERANYLHKEELDKMDNEKYMQKINCLSDAINIISSELSIINRVAWSVTLDNKKKQEEEAKNIKKK
jgi:hypothetical protein